MNPPVLMLLATFATGALSGAAAVGGFLMSGDPPQPAAPNEAAGEQPMVNEAGLPTHLLRAGGEEGDPTPPAEPRPEDGREPTHAEADALRAMRSRVVGLEARLKTVEQTLARVQRATAAEARTDEPESLAAPRTADERRAAMVDAGVDAGLAEEIVFQEAQRSLARLSVRDQAAREGWLGSDRYRAEMRGIDAAARSLREQIGDAIYDRYLYGTGEDNRVQVASVIPGSAAEAVGLEAGDLIESYADERVFRFRDLRGMTTEGELGELVPVRVRRGDRLVETWVPRGPLGVNLDSARVRPLE
ncbi:MAG: PDZ domain-containing protein [Thiocapsa sp.]|jgi:hypothetical protein|nr:PDZ domain-containing protein [Thiocapsa sp.]MCG6896577.1 PDZ domain-containing protein [Thiocapsa sp.]MCG6985697.1 PDZ domain-containing protein [Thiocapsa sp.]